MVQANPRTGRVERVNRKLREITGYSEDELLRMQIADLTHPDDRPLDTDLFQEVVRGEAPSYHLEKRYIRKDASVVWVSVNMTVHRDDTGQPIRTMATIEDITERKRSEEALRESEERFRSTLDNMLEGCQLIGFDWRYRYVNDDCCKTGSYGSPTSWWAGP